MESNSEKVVLEITDELADLRVDKAIATLERIATRSQAARLIQMGRVRINGKVLKPSYNTQLGDRIEIDVPIEAPKGRLVPYDFPLVIPYEDEDLLIVDKPAGLVVHPACGHENDTLVNALLNHTTDLSLGFNEQRPGLVHRIDKDTSGLLVIAKNERAQRLLALQFSRKTTYRLYRALAFGKFKETDGTITSYLRRHPENRMRVASGPDGKIAITHYHVRDYHSAGISHVELRLETGRTHQIRAHLSEAGHPIIGDSVYGADKRLKGLKSVHLRGLISDMPRFALHAMELGFIHPSMNKLMKFTAPWPSDLMPLIEHCGFPRYGDRHEMTVEDEQ